MAGASHVDISVEFAGEDSYVVISDDGEGMTGNGLIEALRYGSRRSYGRSDLGRYGLGPQDGLAVAVPVGDSGHLPPFDSGQGDTCGRWTST